MPHPSRREIIRGIAATAASPWLLGSSAAVTQEPKARLKLAAIGVGGSHGMWKQGTGDCLWASEYGDFVAVCDADMF